MGQPVLSLGCLYQESSGFQDWRLNNEKNTLERSVTKTSVLLPSTPTITTPSNRTETQT